MGKKKSKEQGRTLKEYMRRFVDASGHFRRATPCFCCWTIGEPIVPLKRGHFGLIKSKELEGEFRLSFCARCAPVMDALYIESRFGSTDGDQGG